MTRSFHPTWSLAVALFGALSSGCVLDGGAPDVAGIEPDWAWTGEETAVVLTGSDFFPQPVIDASRGGSTLDEAFTVELVGAGRTHELESVQLTGWERLDARVPAGLPVGAYDVVVTSSTGASDRLDQAFTITDSRADHLQLEFDARPYDVGEQAVVRFQLLDPLGERVRDDLAVAVTLDADISLAALTLDGTGLVDVDAEQGRLVGSLTDGEGWVAVSSTSPANIWLDVAPADSASPIDGDQAFIPVTTGELDSVDVSLPTQTFQATAGEAFDVTFVLRDDNGSALPDTSARLYLSEACHGAVVPDEIDFVGSTTRPITLLRATDTECDRSRLLVTGSAAGESGEFEVAAAEVALLQVRATDASPGTLVAGEQDLMLRVTARDGFMNKVADYDRPIHFRDDVGGLDTLSGVGSMDCVVEWDAGERFCLVGLQRAADEIYVDVYDGLGLTGTTDAPVVVVPAVPVALLVEHGESTLAAGDEFELRVHAEDLYGNRVPLDPTGVDTIEVDDGSGTASCEWQSVLEDQHTLSCQITTAASTIALAVEIPRLGLAASADVLTVTNASLATVELTAPSTVEAGEPFQLSMVGEDSYGNPYTVGNPAVDLRDRSGTLDPGAVALDGTGAYSGSAFTLTTSGDTTVTASASGTDLGSVAITVTAAELSSLEVVLEDPVAWVGEDVDVQVQGVDAYGNVLSSYAGPVSLSSEDGLFITQTVTDFTDGVATPTVQWDTAGLQDRLLASDTVVSGASSRVDAVDECVEGPTASLELDGADETVACILSGTASAAADFSSSAAGASAVAAYHLHDGQGSWARTTSSSSTVSTEVAGVVVAELVVVDALACGSRDTAVLWASTKGEPAGPITVSTSDASRTAGGSASTADATITAVAEDCAGDAPTTSTLYVRTDLGDLSTATTASDGMTLSLSSRTGTTTWSGQALSHDGTATVHVGTLDGAAYGAVEIEVSGDSKRPRVHAVDPLGETSELFDSVVVDFSEALLTSVDFDALVSLEGPDGQPGMTSAASGSQLVLSLDETQDASTGSWVLTVSREVRDASGNKLDGAYDNGNTDFTSMFGDVGSPSISVSSCTAADVLTPDGNDGSGDEAHDLDLQASATAAPAWWHLQVSDDQGVVRTERFGASSASETVVWDARNDAGRIVPAGLYTVELSALDASDNLSAACSHSVQVVEHYGPAE